MLGKLFKTSKQTKIVAPLTGDIVKIEDVADPVFNQKMMGEGIAIRPKEGKVVAPVAGEIVQVMDSKHAVGIKSEDGLEILVHVGLETVALKGQGFTTDVSVGDKVSAGDKLIEFDLEYVKENAQDTITPIVITNSGSIDKKITPTDEKTSIVGETEILTVS